MYKCNSGVHQHMYTPTHSNIITCVYSLTCAYQAPCLYILHTYTFQHVHRLVLLYLLVLATVLAILTTLGSILYDSQLYGIQFYNTRHSSSEFLLSTTLLYKVLL